MNTCFLGTVHTLEHHTWNGKQWDDAERSLWKYNNDVAAEYFTLDQLALLVVRNSGHLLPMDLPDTALEMLRKFMDNESFATTPLPSEKSYYSQLLFGSKHHKHSKDDVEPVTYESGEGPVMKLSVFVVVALVAVSILRMIASKII